MIGSPDDHAVAAISGARDEERIDRHLRDERECERAARQQRIVIEHSPFGFGHAGDHAVALDRDDLALRNAFSRSNDKQRALVVVVDLDRAVASLLHGFAEVLLALADPAPARAPSGSRD